METNLIQVVKWNFRISLGVRLSMYLAQKNACKRQWKQSSSFAFKTQLNRKKI